VGNPVPFQPAEFPLKKSDNPRFEGYIAFPLARDLANTSPSYYYEILVECLIDDKNKSLVAPLLVEIVEGLDPPKKD